MSQYRYHLSSLRSLFLLIGSCMLIGSLPAQVVNTEKLRRDQKTQGWFFDAELTFGATRNTAGQTLRFGTRTRLEYLHGKHKYLLAGQANVTQFLNVDVPGSVPKNFTNMRFIHLRYNYSMSKRITWEAFSQAQFNQIQLIRLRWLTGTGPRIQLLQTDSSRLYLGLIYMYEYEEEFLRTTEPRPTEIDDINRDHRLSTYISASYRKSDAFVIDHITYFQPNLTELADFRISSETTLTVTLTQKVSLKTYFQYIYDTRPPDPAVPLTMYQLSTGLSLAL